MRIRSASVEEELDQFIVSPEWNPAIRVFRYVPSAELEQGVFADENEGGPPAIELSIEGPSQSMRRWLLAEDPERNRLISYIGTWRFMVVDSAADRDALFRKFETELTRASIIRIGSSAGETWRDLPLEVGRALTVPDLGCTVTVRQFLPHYAIDLATSNPVNQSQQRKNPAAFVEIEYQGRKEANWVFAKFPDFGHASGIKLPFRVILDSPIETAGHTPDFAIVSVAGSTHEVWTRRDGKSTRGTLGIGATLAIPSSQYVFRIVDYVPSARLVETYRAVPQGKGKPAMGIEYTDAKGVTALAWLGKSDFKRVGTQVGSFLVGFDDCGGPPHKEHP